MTRLQTVFVEKKAYERAKHAHLMYRFPPELLQRLRRVSPRLVTRLSRMRPMDNRIIEFHKLGIACAGNQVWGINLSRQTKQKFVLKKVHSSRGKVYSAEETIQNTRTRVERYRAMNGITMSRLKFKVEIIPAVAINEDLILMPSFRGVTIRQLSVRRNDLREKKQGTQHMERYDNDLNEIISIGNHLMHSIPTDNLDDIIYIGKDARGVHKFYVTNDILAISME